MARVAVIGAGGIGAFFGGQWQAAGHNVIFCSRRAFSTLRIESPVAPLDTPVACVVDPNLVPPDWSSAEWVFVAVKVHQNPQVRPWLNRLLGSHTRVVVLQNGLRSVAGLGNVDRAADILDSVVYCGAESVAPGVVRHGGGLDLVVPDCTAAQALVQFSAPSRVMVTPVADFVTAKWRKVLFNCAANGITALARQPMGLFADADATQLASDLLTEGLGIARRCGARLDQDDIRRIMKDLRRAEAAAVVPSMLQDRLAGRPTEHDAIYGAVVRAAEERGLPAPLHHFVQRLLACGDPLPLETSQPNGRATAPAGLMIDGPGYLIR